MKKLYVVLLALGAGVLAGCKKENKGPLDPSAMLALNAPKETQANEAATKAADGEQQRLTPRQVIERATELFFYYRDSDKSSQPGQNAIGDERRDFTNNRILLYNSFVIDHLGRLNTNFLDGSDFLLVEGREFDGNSFPPGHPYFGMDITVDTVAYIPSRIIKEASAKIKAAYAQGDYAACYKLFEEAYVFYPITGRALKELQERGEE